MSTNEASFTVKSPQLQAESSAVAELHHVAIVNAAQFTCLFICLMPTGLLIAGNFTLGTSAMTQK